MTRRATPSKALVVAHTTGPVPVVEYTKDLTCAHSALVAAAQTWKASISEERWGIELKRTLVAVASKPPLVPGGDHSFVEVLNQAATIERMLDALGWIVATQQAWTHVHGANPSQTDVGHDLVVGDRSGRVAAFEISDVSSPRNGNANLKMDKDVNTLTGCSKAPTCLCTHAQQFVVCSPISGKWLLGNRADRVLGSWIHPADASSPTWIVELR